MSQSSLRYAIIGAGAVGGLYGGRMAHHGLDVQFLVRNAGWLSGGGLKVESIDGDFYVDAPKVKTSPEAIGPVDVVIITIKSTGNACLNEILPPLVAGGGVVLTLQNGLDVERDATPMVPVDRVLGGCCFLCSNRVAPGHIRHLDQGKIVFGAYEQHKSASPAARLAPRIQADLRAAGVDATSTDDLRTARWRKLMWNIPFNGLSVVLDSATDRMIGHPHSRHLAESLMREVQAGALTCGVDLPDSAIAKTLSVTEEMVPYDSSMRLDHRAGRPMEVEAIFGNPLRAASRGVMPRVEMLYDQLKFLDSTA